MSSIKKLLAVADNTSVTEPKKPDIDFYKHIAKPWTEDIRYRNGVLVLETKSFEQWTNAFIDKLGVGYMTPIPPHLYPRSPAYMESIRQFGKPIGKDHWLFLRDIPAFTYRKPDPLAFLNPFAFRMDPSSLMRTRPWWEKTTLSMSRGDNRIGKVTWDNDTRILILATKKTTDDEVLECGEVWMSLTPTEIVSQRPGVKKAKGNVMIAGLGMGWLARKILERKQVKHVTIVEKDPDILAFFGGALKRDFGSKVTLLCNDAYEWIEPRIPDYDSVIFDIWLKCGDSDYDKRWKSINKQLQDEKITTWAWR